MAFTLFKIKPVLTAHIQTIQIMSLRFAFILLICIYSATRANPNQPGGIPGLPYIQNYLPSDHQGHPQSWWIAQSQEGLMYFANNMGVLEFDGVSWRMLSLPDQKRAINVAIDQENNIYTITSDDFGHFIRDSKGKLVYKSLFADIKSSYGDFGWMIDTWATNKGVYFISAKYIFLLNRNGEYQVWRAGKQSFYKSFLVNNKLYVLKSGEGLLVIRDNVLMPLSGTSIFSKDKSLVLFSEDGKSLIIGRENGSFYKYHHNQLAHFFELQGNYHINASFQSIAVLQNGLWALATKQGILLINTEGDVIQILSKEIGLPGSLITGLFLDQDKTLWAVLDNGITRIDTASPYTSFDDKLGINETAIEVIQHQGITYCATTEGLFYLTSQSDKSIFNEVSGLKTAVWDLYSDGEMLLAATTDGLFQIKNKKAYPVKGYTNNAFVIHRSKIDPKIIFIGGSFGLIALKQTQENTWERLGDITISKTADTFFWIYEEHPGRLWASGWAGGLYTLTFDKNCVIHSTDCLLHPSIESYTVSHGLESGQENQMFQVKDHLVFASRNKILKFNQEQNRFQPDMSFMDIPLDSTSLILSLKELQNGQVIICSASPEKCLLGTPDESGKYKWDSNYFFRLANNPIYDIYSNGQVIWMSGASGVAQYDMHKIATKGTNFNTLVRKVSINNDSTLFFGQDLNYSPPVLSYGVNKLRLEYAATTYTDHHSTQFSYWLEGLDDEWSGWTNEIQKDYTHLPEGAYTFHVKAKNVHGAIGSVDTYAFIILPPWYRTIWAYISYVIIFTFLVFGIVKWRSQQLEKDKKKLEDIIQERTAELERKNEQLKELDQMKSRFFANISHEFRTPLTLILGPLEQLLADPDISSADYFRWQVMTKNAKRLQQLINQLLDLSKLESGKLTLHLKKGDIFRFVKAIAASFSSMGQSNKVQYIQNIPEETVFAYFDPDNLEKIISNLLSNAFKFTESYGKVIIEAQASFSSEEIETGSEDGLAENGWLHIQVQDTGRGIKAHHLSKLFDRFYQADDSDTREKEGSGIGLALVKELADLHGGKVEVESEENIGTTFKVILPIGKKYFDQEQLSEELHKSYDSIPTLEEEATVDTPIEHGDKLLPLILIVEDNPDLRNYIKDCLGHDYAYIEGMNGGEGFKKAQKYMPDLIITDLMMPGMGGTAFCKKIKADELLGHIPLIMLTAKSGVGEKVDGLKTGADDYITKPFNVEELRVRVKNLIEQRKMLRDRYQKEIRVLPGNVTVNSMDEQFLKKALEVVEKNMSDPDFGIDHLLEALNTSRTHLHRKLKAITGQSASEFIRTIRLKRAAQLLERDSNVVSQIGYEVGFNDHSYFTKCFKKYFNMSPSEYAAQAKKERSETRGAST